MINGLLFLVKSMLGGIVMHYVGVIVAARLVFLHSVRGGIDCLRDPV